MEVVSENEVSSVYYITSEQTELSESCEICQISHLPLDKMVHFECHHKACKNCLTEYIQISMEEFRIKPLKCPASNCDCDIYKEAQHVLSASSFSNLKHLRHKKSLLKDPTVKWCHTINCSGYGRFDKNSNKTTCNHCEAEINLTADPETEKILQTCSVLKCPKCSCLIEKTFGCMLNKCYCGADLCMKCGKENDAGHSAWVCLASKNEKVSIWVMILALFAYVLVPALPLFIVFLYRNNWDRNYFGFINEHSWLYGAAILIFSPIILVLALFYLPFVWAWYCLECLFEGEKRERNDIVTAVKIFIYPVVVILTFLAILLGLGLIISFLPLYGIALLVYSISHEGK